LVLADLVREGAQTTERIVVSPTNERADDALDLGVRVSFVTALVAADEVFDDRSRVCRSELSVEVRLHHPGSPAALRRAEEPADDISHHVRLRLR
jgi:hypothetical protein